MITSSTDNQELKKINKIVEKSIMVGGYPGAVILASHQHKIIYQGIFGYRRVKPNVTEMSFDTIFDLASLTKIVVTTIAIMQLIEQKKIALNDTVATYWPKFSKGSKQIITIKQLLVHLAGLPSIVPMTELSNQESILQWIEQVEPIYKPGGTFLYSDVGFIILGHLIERITNQPLNSYAQNAIFNPLGMKDTHFLPDFSLRDRIAPTEYIRRKLHWGKVHDPIVAAMGGIGGSAGLFSTAHDLAIFLKCLLMGGIVPNLHGNILNQYILHPDSVKEMIKVHTPTTMLQKRSLGWDIDSMPYNGGRSKLFSPHAFGHTGWTGTSMWVDPNTKTWIIILTSRVHPIYQPEDIQIFKDRLAIADIIATYVRNHISNSI